MTSPLDDGYSNEARRRSSAATGLYHALLDTLDPADRDWVLEVVARQRLAEHRADEGGEPLPRALW